MYTYLKRKSPGMLISHSARPLFYPEVIQYRARVHQNPHPTPGNAGAFHGWGWTAHHIVPVELLNDAYDLLSAQQKASILSLAGSDQLREWPPGNIFYGPKAEVRIDFGDGYDIDGDKFRRTSLRGYYDVFHSIVEYAKNHARGAALHQGLIDTAMGKELFSSMRAFYTNTHLGHPFNTREDQWNQLKTEKEVKRSQAQNANTSGKVYYKVSSNQAPVPVAIPPLPIAPAPKDITFHTDYAAAVVGHHNYNSFLPKLTVHGGNVYYIQNLNNFEIPVPILLQHSTFKANEMFLKYDNTSANVQNAITYLKQTAPAFVEMFGYVLRDTR